jgi:multidrug resistance efflux pump
MANVGNQKQTRLLSIWCLAGAIGIAVTLLLGGCLKEQKKAGWQQRRIPVHILELEKSRLGNKARLSGSVLPWKTEDVRFQVPGKLAELKILMPGARVRGELRDETKKIIYEGDAIAVLDTTPYQLAVTEASANVEVAKIRLVASQQSKQVAAEVIHAAQTRIDASMVEINEIVPQDLKIAKEQYGLAKNNHELVEKAFVNKDVTDSRRAEARANMEIALSTLKKAELQKGFKEKELQTYKAELVKSQVEEKLREAEEKIAVFQLTQAEIALTRAASDLQKCTLRVPFSGVVAKIYVNPGTMVDLTTPIVNLVMIDPVRIDVAVSFKKIRDFYFGNEVKVYPLRERSKPEKGYVYNIQTTADPATRTFLAIISVRNYEYDIDNMTTYNERSSIPLANDMGAIVRRNPDGSGSFYIDVRAVQRDDRGTYVWKIKREQGQRFTQESVVQKTYIVLDEQSDYVNVITWLFRKLKDTGGVTEEDGLLVNPPANLKDNDKILQLRQDWMFHPGELVEVEYDRELAEGVYLPSEAILESDDKKSYYVFVVEDVKADGINQVGVAKYREIVKRQVEDLWKIEKGLETGDKVVVHGRDAVKTRYEASSSPTDAMIQVQIQKSAKLSDLVKGYNMVSGNSSSK